jgi:hypothetical protein
MHEPALMTLTEDAEDGRLRLGELLVLKELLAHDEIEHALEEQRDSGRRLGEILLDRGLVSELVLRQTLAELANPQVELEEGFTSGLRLALLERQAPRRGGADGLERADGAATGRFRRRLGELLLMKRLIEDHDLIELLDEHARTGSPLGQLALERSLISETMLATLLTEQRTPEPENEGGLASGLRRRIDERYRPPSAALDTAGASDAGR